MRSKIGFGVLGITVAFLLATNPVVVNAHGLIGSAQIKKGAIKSKHVKPNAIKSKHIKNNKIKGVDINEATLGTVPSATNATMLNAQPASTYLNTAYDFTLPVTAASTSKVFAAPVPPGKYLATYNVIATGASPRCALYGRVDLGETGKGFQDGFGNGGFFMSSSHAIVTVAPGQSAALWCFGGSFALYPGTDGTSSLSLTKLDTVNTVAATGGRQGPAVSGGGLR